MFWPARFKVPINVFSVLALLSLVGSLLLAFMLEWTGSAACAALFAAFVALLQSNSTEARIESQAALDAYTYLVRAAVKECCEGRVERAHWNMIARTLASAEELEPQITYLPHRRAMDAEKTIARHRLLEYLASLGEGWFWGVGDPDGLSEPELVRASCGRGNLNYVSEESLVRIYHFAEFEEAYRERDPLNGLRFNAKELRRIGIIYRGLARYLKVHRENHVGGGVIRPRNPQPADANETLEASSQEG